MKVNISIDDVSPHPYSSVRVLEKCEELLSLCVTSDSMQQVSLR